MRRVADDTNLENFTCRSILCNITCRVFVEMHIMVEEQTCAGDESGSQHFYTMVTLVGGHHNRVIMWDITGSRWAGGNDWMERRMKVVEQGEREELKRVLWDSVHLPLAHLKKKPRNYHR